jgi:hypothetical protein
LQAARDGAQTQGDERTPDLQETSMVLIARAGRCRPIFCVLALAGALALAAPVARAGTFTAFTCHGPDGQPIGAQGWSASEAVGGYFIFTNLTCATAGQAISSQLGPGTSYANAQGAQLAYAPPPGITIASYALNLSAYAAPCPANGGGCTGGVGEVWVIHSGDVDPNYDWRTLGGGNWSGQVAESGLHATDVSTNTSCDTYPYTSTWTCPGGEIASIAISSGAFKLYDSSVPSVSDVRGPLTSGRRLSGSAAIFFTAQDSGSGIYSALVYVDGTLVEEPLLDSNDGQCVDLGQTTDGTRSFSSPQPCAGTVDAAVALNTNQLSPGRHQVQVLVDDAAGDQDTVWDGTIRVKRAHIANGDPCPGEQLTVTLNGRHGHVAVRYGRHVTLRGLLHCGRQAIRGARVLIAGGGIAADVRTRKNGTFRYRLPLGPSRQLSVSYTAYSDDPRPAASVHETIAVRPQIELTISPHQTENGATIYWNGSIGGGPYPRNGVALLAEVREGDRWVAFDQIVAAEGRFSYQYTFTRTDRPTSYLFRVSLPHGGAAGYHYAQGASAAIPVYVR